MRISISYYLFSQIKKWICSSISLVIASSIYSQDTLRNQIVRDSVIINSYLQSSLSASYSDQRNWLGQDFKNLSFAGSINYSHNASAKGWRHQHIAMADLSYLKFIDSLWFKNTNRIAINLLWHEQQSKILHSYSLAFQSQFLPSYQYNYDYEKRIMVRSHSAYSFNPSALELGYGALLQFWQTSSINFAFASLRFTSTPKPSAISADELPHFATTNRSYLNINYGFSVSTNIRKKMGDRVEWWNNSRVFCNAVDREHINFECLNRINIKLWKYLQLRFDTKLAYNPQLNYNIQFSQEVLVGIFFEKAK